MLKFLAAVPDQEVLHSGRALVLIDVVILRRVTLYGDGLPFAGSSHIGIIMVFNQPPKPTHPGHPCIGEMSTVDGSLRPLLGKRWLVLCIT